jgi:hypothetical protein
VCADAEAAARAWESLAQVTDGVYADDLVFGRSREWVGTPDRPVNAHAGHWKDRLPNVRANAAWARDLLARHSGAAPQQTFRVYPGEEPPTPLPVIRHSPVTEARPGTELVIRTRVESAQPLRRVVLRHRPMDQTQPWVAVNMRETAPGRYEAAIPGDRIPASVDLLYYLEARIEGGGTLWPDWRDRAPYVKVSTGHDEPAGRGDTHGG